MRYLFNMGLSGSALTVVYLLGKLLLQGSLDPKWRCLATRGILLYYLVPITFLKGWFSRWYRPSEGQIAYVDSGKSLILYTNGKRYLNAVFQKELLLGGIWVLAAAGVFLLMLLRYRKAKQFLDRSSATAATLAEKAELFEEIRRNSGIRRKVRYLDSTPADGTRKTAFTVGVWNPVILYPADREDPERQLIVEHELAHIRHGDLLWQMLASMACILHCINPFAWYLKGELAQAAELYCDRTVLQGRDAQTGRTYANLLLEMAKGGRKGWAAPLSGSGRRLRERMEGILQPRKYLGKTVSAAAVILAVSLNSLTVLAYQDVQVWSVNVDDKEREKIIYSEIEFEFAPIDLLEEARFQGDGGIEILYDCQFIDAEGNIYPVPEEETLQTEAVCSHHYVQGQASTHERNGSGGCTVTFYEADRCTLCGNAVLGEELYFSQWKACPH